MLCVGKERTTCRSPSLNKFLNAIALPGDYKGKAHDANRVRRKVRERMTNGEEEKCGTGTVREGSFSNLAASGADRELRKPFLDLFW